jgi:hypothetical protein
MSMMRYANLKDPWIGRTQQGLPTLGQALGLKHRFTYNYTDNKTIARNADDLIPYTGILTSTAEEAGTKFRYDKHWDHEMMHGCICDEGFFGPDCSMWSCPTGDDPLTGTLDSLAAGLDYQYNEVQNITCNATGGSFTLTFRKKTSEPIMWDDEAATVEAKIVAIDTVADATVKFQEWGGTACNEYGHAFTVEFTQDMGDLPLLYADWSKLTHDVIFTGFSPYMYIFELSRGTREDDVCSNRGICDPISGVCLCVASDSPDFDTSNGEQPARIGDAKHNRGDCGWPTKVITGCPGEIACSAHGVCAGAPEYRCTCSVGYGGADCSEFVCASSAAWFDTPIAHNVAHQPIECANMGHCDRTKGTCMCMVGFAGGSCNRLSCAGADTSGEGCYGHGACMSMQRLAEELIGADDGTFSRLAPHDSRGGAMSVDIGELTPTTYGTTPNNPATWDFNMIHMCACDEGWMGHNCDFRSCPSGPDPMVEEGKGSTFEVQHIACRLYPKNKFRLSFRAHRGLGQRTSSTASKFAEQNFRRDDSTRSGRYITRWLDSQVSARELQIALMELDSIGAVNVTYTHGNEACIAGNVDASNAVLVTFLTELGNLPDMRVDVVDDQNRQAADTNAVIQINQDGAGLSVKGTKQNVECSRRGICNRATGQCKCFQGYTSSDGNQKPGSRGDCGAVLEYVQNYEAES